jgi:DNA-binding winged helix-turn-helix (wHTH) protein
MSHRFGRFELDTEKRLLALDGAPQTLQPLVFDFLAYLVARADRVVGKDELFDALWPDVIVTESSLQRVASLARRALAAGDMADAIRSHSKHGYRFEAPAAAPASGQTLAEARAASRDKHWDVAARLFAAANAQSPLEPADLELWAAACQCMGRPAEAVPALLRAIAAYQQSGEATLAGRAAVTIARIEFDRGAHALAEGWIERAASLAATSEDEALRAYLGWIRAVFASIAGNATEALALASAASDQAERSGSAAMRALTLAFKGFYLLSLGEIEEGRRLQNHAAAITLSSPVDPVTGGLVYCNILWSCRTHADWDRASQWSDGFEAWCAASFAQSSGSCDLHRAELLGARGNLTDALRKLDEALPKLMQDRAIAMGEAHRIRGDVFAMLGDRDRAASDYASAYALGWDAEPGNAVLLFERGNAEGALAALDRTLAGKAWFHLQRRGLMLAHAARIAALSGRRERAQAYLAQLTDGGDRWAQPALLALAAEARAALTTSRETSANFLVQARQLWGDAGLDYDAARVRLALATTYRQLGEPADAEAELAQAEFTARRIQSPRLTAACAALRAAPKAKELLRA